MIKEDISLGDYIIKPILLGSGSFSEVYEGYKIEDKRKVAIKIISKKVERDVITRIEHETNILKKLRHPNIVKLLKIHKTEEYIYIIMEKYKCEVKQWITEMKTVPERIIKKIMIELRNGMKYLHENNIIHRDLKMTNLLLDNFIDEEDFLSKDGIVKISDFGLSTDYSSDLNKTICGTPLYMAPEIFINGSYNNKIDLWSIGVILYELYYKKPPYSAGKLTNLIIKLKTSELEFPYTIDFHAMDLIKKLLIKNPVDRLSFNSFFSHPFFGLDTSINDSLLTNLYNTKDVFIDIENESDDSKTNTSSDNIDIDEEIIGKKSEPINIKSSVQKSNYIKSLPNNQQLPTLLSDFKSFKISYSPSFSKHNLIPSYFSTNDPSLSHIRTSQMINIAGSQVEFITNYFK